MYKDLYIKFVSSKLLLLISCVLVTKHGYVHLGYIAVFAALFVYYI